MKKLLIVLSVLLYFGNLFAQTKYEKVGSLYNFWRDPSSYEVVGDYTYITHDYMIDIYHIKADGTLELVTKIKDQLYGRETKVVGKYLFATSGNTNLGVHYLAFDLTDPTNPQKVKDIIATDSDLNIIKAVVNGGFAYSENLKVWNISDILNPTLISSTLEDLVNPNGALTAKPLEMDGEYLIYELFFYSTFTNSRGWKYYKIDVSNSSDPINLGQVSKPNPEETINDTLTYSLGNGYSTSFLIKIYNNSDPDNPVEISSISGNRGEFAPRTYFAKVGNYIYGIVGTKDTYSQKLGDLYIINVSDPYNPILEKVYHPQTNYYAPNGNIKIGNKVYALNRKAQFGIIDFTDTLNPAETITELSDAYDGGSLVKVEIKGDYAFVQGNAKNDRYDYPIIRIIDISDPTNMVEVAIIDSASLWQVEGDYLYSGKPGVNNYGFSIYNISDPTNPTFESFFKRETGVGRLKVHNGYAYLTIGPYQTKFYVVDVRDASNPKLKSIFGVIGHDFCFDGNSLYVDSKLQKWDITDPVNPVNLGEASSYTRGMDRIEFRENKIFTFGDKMNIYDISNFPTLEEIGNYNSSSFKHSFSNTHVFLALEQDGVGVRVVDIHDLNNPTLTTTIEVPSFYCNDVAYSNNYIFTANKHSFDVYKLNLSASPEDFTLISPESLLTTTTANLLWHKAIDSDSPTVFYDVYMATESDFSDIYKVAEGITDTSITVSDLQIGKTYYWKVQATDNNTTGTWSTNNMSFTILSPNVTEKFTKDIGGETKGGVTVLDENIIYVPSSSKIVRLNGDGGIEYTLNVNGIIKSSSTITSDHTVYIASTDNNLYSFNSSGVTNPNWPVALGAQATASVAVGPNNNLYIGTSNGIFQAISRNGDILWSYNVGAAVYSSSVISSNNTLYVSNKNGRLFAFNLNTLDPSNVQYKWKVELGEAVSSSPALDIKNNLYVTTELGKLIKVDGNTGSIKWTYNSEGICKSSPIIDGTLNIYFAGKGGKVFSVNGTSGNLNWETETHYSHSNPDSIIIASPTLSSDGTRIYVGDTFGTIYGISTITGKIVWVKENYSTIDGPILAANNKIYFCTDGVVVALNEPSLGLSKNRKEITISRMPLWSTFQGNAQRTGYNGDNFLQEYKNIVALRENDENGVPVLLDSLRTITGIITVSNQLGNNGPAFIQDNEAGVSLYGSGFVSNINLGDSVTVTGKVGFYNALTQLKWDSEKSEVIVHKNINNPLPKTTTIAEVLNQSWNWLELEEGMLVKINNVSFEVSGTFTTNTSYSFTDGTNSLICRIYNDVNLVSETIPTKKVDLIGVIGQFKSTAPHNTGYQLLLRFKDDIKATTNVNETMVLPTAYTLSQNYPNPFNPTTMVKYSIPENANVKIEIFNMLGQSVNILVNSEKSAGFYEINWNASNLPSGIYLISIRANGVNSEKNFVQVKKALLLK